MGDCRYRLLTGGGLKIEGDSELSIAGPIQRALFVILLLQSGDWLSRDYVADLLWPECDQATARQRLRATLFNLRQGLTPKLQDDLRVRDDALRLDVPRSSIDVFRFTELASQRDRDAHQDAISLYQGDLLSSFSSISDQFDQMLFNRREELRQVFTSLCTDDLVREAERNELAAFDVTLRKALRVDRTNSSIVSIAMKQFAERGLANKVEEIFDGYQRALMEELDAEPEAHMTELRNKLVALAIQKMRQTAASTKPSVGAVSEPRVAQYLPKRAHAKRYSILMLRGLAVAVILVAAGWFWFLPRVPDKLAGPVFVLSLDQPGIDGCSVDLNATLDQTIQGALREIPGSSIIIGDPNSLPMDLTNQVFTMEKVVFCSDQSTRLTLTMTRVSTQELAMVHRYNVHATTLDELGDVIITDVIERIAQ